MPLVKAIRFDREHVQTVPIVEEIDTIGQPRYGQPDRLLECAQSLRFESLVASFRKHDSQLPFQRPTQDDNDLTLTDVYRRCIRMVIRAPGKPEPQHFHRLRLADGLEARQFANPGESSVGCDGQTGTNLTPTIVLLIGNAANSSLFLEEPLDIGAHRDPEMRVSRRFLDEE